MPYHDDAEATQWLQDYWDYVQMIEHGNEPSLDEIGGWDGLAQAFTDEDVFNQTVQYISDDVESDDINSDAGQLLSRLKQLKDRYMGMSKMKKSALQKENEEICEYEVHTANEDGWTDYHEEDDITDDFDIAIDWLKRSDVKWGEIRCNGELVAWTEENPNYDPEYGGSPNIIEYAEGWGRNGKIASTKKMKKSDVKSQMPKSFIVDVGFEIPFRDHYDEGVWVNGHNSDEEGNAIGIWLDGKDVWIGLQFLEDYDEVSYSICPIGSSTPIKEEYHKIDSVDGIIGGLEQFLINAGISEESYGLEKSQDIHSMIADIRKNNNSLKKSRVDLGISKNKIIDSPLSPYELVRLSEDERFMDESEFAGFFNPNDRYHIVDYNGKTLASAKTLEDCIPLINRLNGWGVDAVVDEKDLVAYDIKYGSWGAGHGYASHLVCKY